MIVIGLLHIAISSVLVWFLAGIYGALTPWIAGASLFIGFGVAVFIGPKMNESLGDLCWKSFSSGMNGVIEKAIFVFVCWISYRHFAYLLYHANGGINSLSPNNFGDLPLHLNYIRQIAIGDAFPPINPGYSLDRLRYPLGVDLYSALWESLGVLTQAHLFLFSIFSAFASLIALRAWAGWWGMGGFFLSGSWLSWEILTSGKLLELQTKIAWKNLFLAVFVTQRGMLFALPAGLLLLHFARRVFIERLTPSRAQLAGFGFLWGSLALFHLHSFFCVTIIMFGLALIYTDRNFGLDIIRKLAIAAVPIGTFFTMYSTGLMKKASVAHWRAGWMAEPGQFLSFIVTNFGPYILLALILPLLITGFKAKQISKENQKLLAEWAFYIALFVLFLNLMLAPWDWDNVKVLLWPYLGILLLARTAFHRFQNKSWNWPVQVGAAIILFLAGTATLVESSRTLNSAVRLFSLSEVANAAGAIRNVPVTATFAAAPSHDHVLSWLGRRRALGYDGHMWSHGIDVSQESADLEKLMKGEEDWLPIAIRLRVTHLFWGPAERIRYEQIDPVWRKTLTNISSVKGYEVYEVRK